VKPIAPEPTTFNNFHNSDLFEHLEVLGRNRLRDLHPNSYFSDRPFFAIAYKPNHLSPPRFCDCVEDVGGCRSPSNWDNVFLELLRKSSRYDDGLRAGRTRKR
jgi:hypothetical protein